MSPKRKQGEEGDLPYPGHKGAPRRKVTVLETRDLEGEYLLVLARLQLIKIDADPTHATGWNEDINVCFCPWMRCKPNVTLASKLL